MLKLSLFKFHFGIFGHLQKMEKFVVSARKYRPATFDTVVGQASITTTLKNAIRTRHLAQAFLFSGPRGVGKTTCARILAKTINCNKLSADIEACNECESCISFNQGNSLNIFELDAASKNSVDDIRELVEQVKFSPIGGRYKVYIIDEVHMLSTSAFNAFLKTLEEPPSYAIFILATTEKQKILPTILSRCQLFDFNRIQVQDISLHLAQIAQKEQISFEAQALDIIAQKADGALRDSLSMFDQLVTYSGGNITYQAVLENLNVLDYEYFLKLTEYFLAGDFSSSLLLLDEILNKGFDGQHFINGLASHFRNLLFCKNPATAQLLQLSESVLSRYLAQAKLCSSPFVFAALEIANQCELNYRGAKNQRLQLELALLNICKLNTETLNPAVQDEKKKSEPISRSADISASSPVAPVAPVAPALPKAPSVQIQPETVVPAKPNPAPAKVLLNVGGSLSAALKPQQKALENTNVDTETLLANGQNPIINIAPEQLEAEWQKYGQQAFDSGKKSLFAILSGSTPVQVDNTIQFVVYNKVQEEELLQEKTALLQYLRSVLNNKYLLLQITLTEEAPTSMEPYGDVEKLKYLIEKNPAIKDLKDRLGLDL